MADGFSLGRRQTIEYEMIQRASRRSEGRARIAKTEIENVIDSGCLTEAIEVPISGTVGTIKQATGDKTTTGPQALNGSQGRLLSLRGRNGGRSVAARSITQKCIGDIGKQTQVVVILNFPIEVPDIHRPTQRTQGFGKTTALQVVERIDTHG